jgi:signal peptidase
MLTSNLIFIIKGSLNPNLPPSIFGITPMIVVSGSMSGQEDNHIEVGDMVFVKRVKEEDLQIGDVIAFQRDNSLSVITHRITDIRSSQGKLMFQTKGDANNVVDPDLVSGNQVLGLYFLRIPKLGSFALYLQEPLGMTIFIGIPILAFLLYDIIQRHSQLKVERENTAKLQAEIRRLQNQSNDLITSSSDS